MELDETFDPSTTEAQTWLRDFSDKFWEEDFSATIEDDFECSVNLFDRWLQNQSGLADGTANATYTSNCGEATGLPMDPSKFHGCLTAWVEQEEDEYIFSREGVVKIIILPFATRVRFDSPNQELRDEWQLTDDWFNEVQTAAPAEANKAYFSSHDYWWFDTNQQMFSTAMGSVAIAISAAAIIILISSMSLIMTLFSVISVGYVLVSVTAMMVAFDWRLGFRK